MAFAIPINNVSSKLAAPTSGSGTFPQALTLTTSIPTVTGPAFCRVTILTASLAYTPTITSANYTIYSATSSGTALTLTGLLDGTTDHAYAAGDVVEIRVTAGTISDIHTAINGLPSYDLLSTLVNSPVSISGTTALSSGDFGKTHVCSGTSANYTVTLPSPNSNANKFIGFRMDPGLTKLVTIAQNSSDLIDGATTRVMWANEAAILGTDGTNWFKIAGKTIPMNCVMYRTGYVTVPIPNVTVTFVPMMATSIDNTSQMGNVSSGYVNILRSSNYTVGVFLLGGPATSVGTIQSVLLVNGTTGASQFGNCGLFYVPNTAYAVSSVAYTLSGIAGQFFAAGCYQNNLNGGGSSVVFGASPGDTAFTVYEITGW